jgi:NADH dehydrogenase FAD-containing subunit
MIRDAGKIVIVGGGPVGVELAGEIRDAYPDKDITIVHRGPYLCSSKNGGNNGNVVPAAFGENLAGICRDKGITVRLGQGVTGVATGDPASGMVAGPGDVTLDSGEILRGMDLAVFVTGIRVNNETFRSTMATHLNPQGRLVVSQSMLVPTGSHNVFALGDCAEAGGSKTAYHAMQQAQVVASNVLALAGGASEASLKRYDAGGAAMIVPVGKDQGRAFLPPCGGITLGDGMVSTIKGKDLFLQQTRKDMGEPAAAAAASTA